MRPPAGAGAACRAATAAALENEKKTSRTSFKDNGSEVETPTGEPKKTPPPREAGDHLLSARPSEGYQTVGGLSTDLKKKKKKKIIEL